MRIYKNEKPVLETIVCNRCGKRMKTEDGIVKEGWISHTQQFGYFSHKDGEIHSFDLCEDCYDKFVSEFAVPVEIKETEELV